MRYSAVVTPRGDASVGKEAEEQPRFAFTVFTATYNRAHTLPRLCEALRAQTFRDFEWLIVDDGSTDATAETVAAWVREGVIPIRYVQQPHGHKKAAFNRGVSLARGELFLSLDSDDTCVPHALERFWFHWGSIPADRRGRFSGVTCLCQDEAGRIVGDRFPGEIVDSDSLEMRHRFKVRGEKWGFHRTEVLRRFPFPEDVAGHVPEDVVWMAIARQYKTRYANEALRIYHQGGPAERAGRVAVSIDWRRMAPGHVVWMLSILSVEWPYWRFNPRRFVWAAATLTRFCLHGGQPPTGWWRRLSRGARLLVLAAAPAGALLWTRDHLARLKRKLQSQLASRSATIEA